MESSLKKSKAGKSIDVKTSDNIKLTAQLFDKFGETIRDMIRFQVNDESAVDDIFQDLFVSLAYSPIPSGILHTEKYLCRAVNHDILDKTLQSESYQIRNQRYAEQFRNHTKYHNPEDIAIQAEKVQKLVDIIERQLMPHEAKAIIHRYYYGRDIDAAAQVMCINKRSFSRYLSTGLKKIRQYVRENEKVIHDLSRVS